MSRGFGDNGDGGIVLSGVLDHGDLLVVIDALSFQSTRSRFFGGGPDISDRLDAIVEKLKSVSPLPPGERTHGYEWFRACSSVKSSAFFGCYLVEERTGYDSRAYHLDVVADRSVQRVVRGGSRGEIEAALQGVSSCLRELAPLSAEPVVILAGTLELSAPVEVPGTHRETGAERREVLRPLAEAVGKALSTVTPAIRIIVWKWHLTPLLFRGRLA